MKEVDTRPFGRANIGINSRTPKRIVKILPMKPFCGKFLIFTENKRRLDIAQINLALSSACIIFVPKENRMKERLILVTNDDGYDAKGIRAAIEVARNFGRV
ncbi:MAG: hypothetical protein RSB29_06325, partial [Alistipes sp.]